MLVLEQVTTPIILGCPWLVQHQLEICWKTGVSPEYLQFQDIFCPAWATRLPTHRPRDCAIDLQEGEPVPRSIRYPCQNEDLLKAGFAECI